MSKPTNHKFKIAVACLGLAGGALASSYHLALKSRMTADWVGVVSSLAMYASVIFAGFAGANAFITKAAITKGVPAPEGNGEPDLFKDDER